MCMRILYMCVDIHWIYSLSDSGVDLLSRSPILGWQLTLLLLNMTCIVLAKSEDPDQLASALFVIKHVNF